jgi:CelD/BcsL family acetyltransferase involved in cellulose biosynthesis
MQANAVQIKIVESARDFAALENEWERLQKDAASSSVFASFDWQHLWWKSYGRGKLRVLVALSAGVPIGILPLYIDPVRMMRLPVRLLRFVGTGGDTWPDDLGPILAKGRETEAARELARAVMELGGWDVLTLTDMDPACAFTAEIKRAANAGWMRCLEGRSERITYTELPATWDAWLGSLHRDRRYRIRNVRKKINAKHQVRFFVWKDAATLDQGVDRLVQLHNKRWSEAGESHGFSTPEYVGFHRAVMHACQARDRLRLYCLEIDGQVAAIYYFYRFRDRVYLMQSGFDPDFSDVKPGQALLGYVIEDAIGEGHKVLDFLRGDHRYKDEIATGERETVYLTAMRPLPGALIYGTRRLVLPKLKAYVMKRLDSMRTNDEPPKPEKP